MKSNPEHPHPGAGRGAVVEPAILAALLEGGAHGYEIKRSIESMTGRRLSVDPGGLYRLLRKLEADGFVSSAWAQGDAGPQRRCYELTADGRALAREWAEYLCYRARIAGSLAERIEERLEP